MQHSFFAQTDVYSSEGVLAGAALLVVFLVITLGAALLGYVVRSWALGRIFKKAGVASWRAWVPVYNQWVLLQLGGQAGWWSVVMFVPFVNIVALVYRYVAQYYVGAKLQKQGPFLLLAIFLPIVWYIWLGVDSSKWDDTAGPTRVDTTTDADADADADVNTPAA